MFDKNGKIMYSGEWYNDKPEGYGHTLDLEGDGYIGYLKNGFPNGKGKIYKKNNLIYEGEFVNGYYEGIGKLVFENGGYYLGEWKKGLMNGRGKL